MAQTRTVLLSSAGTATMGLNPVSKSTTFTLTTASCSSGFFTVQYALGDPSAPGYAGARWAPLSSAAAIASSGLSTSPLSWTLFGPVAQARIYSSAWDISTAATMVLKALQSVTA